MTTRERAFYEAIERAIDTLEYAYMIPTGDFYAGNWPLVDVQDAVEVLRHALRGANDR